MRRTFSISVLLKSIRSLLFIITGCHQISKQKKEDKAKKEKEKKSHMRSTLLPLLNTLSVNAQVMLVVKYLVDLGLMKGAVEIMRKICYQNSLGPD